MLLREVPPLASDTWALAGVVESLKLRYQVQGMVVYARAGVATEGVERLVDTRRMLLESRKVRD